MTYEERIQILDNGIIRMNTYLSYGAAYNDHLDSTGNKARQEAYDVLTKIEASRASLYAVKNISFDSCCRNMWGCNVGEYEIQCANKCNAYKQSVNSIISILEQERTRLIKAQADTEQKKGYEAQIANNTMQQQSLKWSKIAAWAGVVSAFIGLASIAFSIFLYLCKH